MNYFYDTATEKVLVEASKKWTDIVKDEDRKIASQNRKERRHTLHYDESMEGGDWLASDKDNPFYTLCRETPEEERNRLNYAISRLTETEQRMIDYEYFKGYSHKRIAEMEGVSRQAIEQRLGRIIKKLQEIF